MTTIIRIEHPYSGWGLFKAYDENGNDIVDNFEWYEDLCVKHCDFPTPCADIGKRQYDEFCAFKTVEQLQEWVKANWLKDLIQVGFKVLMLDVSACRVGEYQILYKKKDILQTKDISSLFI